MKRPPGVRLSIRRSPSVRARSSRWVSRLASRTSSERRPVDASIWHPAGRRARAAARARLGRLASPRGLFERGRQVGLFVELLQLICARPLARALERVPERADVGAPVGVALRWSCAFGAARVARIAAGAGSAGGRPVAVAAAAAARARVGRADDVAIALRPPRQRPVLAVGDPDELRVEVVERLGVVGAEDLVPDRVQRAEGGGLDGAVVGARVQVGHRAARGVARKLPADHGRRGELREEARHDAVEHRSLQREPHEPAAAAVGGELPAAVGLHAWLLEQRAVDGELALGRVLGGCELAVALGDPQLGVLGVEDRVDRHAVGAQDRAALERAGEDRVPRAEQLVAVEVDGAAAQLDVPGLAEPWPISAHTGNSRWRISLQSSDSSR